MRATASAVIANGAEHIAAARMALRIVNSLPRDGRASDRERDEASRVVASMAGMSGHEMVNAGFDRCYRNTRASLLSLRQCLGSVHDKFIGELNTRYWKATEAGM